jgi:hypothetical protein
MMGSFQLSLHPKAALRQSDCETVSNIDQSRHCSAIRTFRFFPPCYYPIPRYAVSARGVRDASQRAANIMHFHRHWLLAAKRHLVLSGDYHVEQYVGNRNPIRA